MSTPSKHYRYMVGELARPRYRTYTICDLLKATSIDPDIVHVAVRIDVDSGLESCPPLATDLRSRGIRASFYFLTHPNRYYDIWESDVPKLVHQQGFEVGVHTDHYYEQLTLGTDALEQIRHDVNQLANMIGSPVYGMVAHGHPAIDQTDKRNWDVYRDIPPPDLGLEYHDGVYPHLLPRGKVIPILDFLGVTNGWRYWPRYPQRALRRVPLGSAVIFFIHPENLFQPGPRSGAGSLKKLWRNVYYFGRIRLRHQVIGALIGEGKSARQELRNRLRVKRTGERP